MLVKDLIKFLEKEDENAVVLLSSDEEGNSFSKLSYGFGTVESKKEKDLIEQTGGLYGLEPEDMNKNWLILYPEM